MEEDEDDDIYAPEDVITISEKVDIPIARIEKKGDDLEEGEEEGEELDEDASDSDIDIITERKDDGKVEALHPQRVSSIKKSPIRTSSLEPTAKSQQHSVTRSENSAKPTPSRPGTSYPAIKTSKIDIDARPIYDPNGRPITEIDMDGDFPEDDKPWRRPGTDMTDYFNYGFDEFTWASYCLKQDSLRKEVLDSKKQMEDMQSFLGMPGGMPTIPGMPAQIGGAQQTMAMGSPADIPPEMQHMMAQMMAQGLDPTQIDPATFMQMMQGGQASANGAQGQSFGGVQGFGQQAQNTQQMNFGYGAGGVVSGGSGNGNGGGGGNNSGGSVAGSGGGGSGGGGAGRTQGGRGQNRRNW